MFRRLSRKSAKQTSALKGQRPKRRTDSHAAQSDSFRFLSKRSFIFFGCAAATLIVWTNRRTLDSGLTSVSKSISKVLVLAPKEWHVHMAGPDGNPLGEELKREILKTASSILKTGSPSELQTLEESLEGIGSLENIQVIRPQYGTVVISAATRQPAMLVQVGGKIRYLTAEATVYGDTSNQSGNPNGVQPTVLVSGIFDARPPSSIQLDHSARVITTPEEHQILLNVIALWRISLNQGLALRAVTHQRFRGFDIKLEDDSEVILGSAPFEYKMDKLVGIFAKLRKQGVTASRIELDYDGKAFIKERKL